jgi:hypothetical protein
MKELLENPKGWQVVLFILSNWFLTNAVNEYIVSRPVSIYIQAPCMLAIIAAWIFCAKMSWSLGYNLVTKNK